MIVFREEDVAGLPWKVTGTRVDACGRSFVFIDWSGGPEHEFHIDDDEVLVWATDEAKRDRWNDGALPSWLTNSVWGSTDGGS